MVGRRPGAGAVALVLALAAALWLASTLGFVHRVAHAPHASALSMAAPADMAAAGTSAFDPGTRGAAAHAHGRWTSLFGDHAGPDDCRLYDQLAGGFAIGSVPAVVLPIALPMARFHHLEGEAIARWIALFDARGPPATR